MIVYVISSPDDSSIVLTIDKDDVAKALTFGVPIHVNTWDTDEKPTCRIALDIDLVD